MKVGERIKKRRKKLGMTVDELAERVGKSPPAYRIPEKTLKIKGFGDFSCP